MFGKYSTANSSTNKLTSLSLQSVPPELRFSLPYLKKLHQILTDNEVVNEHNESLVIEILYTIAEMVVYGDNKSEMLFDFFCEKNMLSLFLRIMWAPQQIDTGHICPIKVHIQILQTLSILINSVKNNTSLYYILSNNYINEILIFPHNFDEDESLRDQFVSFMKTLSLRLNPQTIQFFFVEETGSFPLLSKSIDMLHYSEPMVRIASQTTILNIFKVCDNRARVYALQDEFLYKFLSEIVKIMETFYYTIIQHILDYIIISKELNSIITNNKTDIIIKLNKIELLINDQISSTEDWFYFIQDLLDLKINKLRRITIYYILSEFIYSLLLSSIFSYSQSNIDTSMYSMTIIRNSNDSGKSSNNEEIKDSVDVQKNNQINMNSSFNANEDVNTSGDDSNNINNLNEIEIKESNDKLLVFALVSLHTIAQMFRIIIDPMFQRALTVAIFHPLSSTGRRKALMKLIPSSPSSIHGSNDSIPSDEDNTYQLNNFRQIFHHMYNQDNNRLTYFCVLIYLHVNTIRLSMSIESIESIDSNVNLSKYINEWCYNISDDNYLDMKITPMKSIPESISPMPIQGFNTAMLLSPEYATSSSSFDSQNVFVPMKISQDFDDDIKVDNKIESNDEIKPNRNLDYNINNKTEANVNILKEEHYVYEITNELINNVVSNYTNTSDDSINNDESTNILNIIDKENIVSLPDDTIEKSNENVINKPKQYSLKYFAEPDDLEKDFDSMDSSSINQQIDIISIEKLKYIYDCFSLNNNNENICNDYLCQEFFGVLSRSPFNYSIITYQSIVHTIYYHILLLHQQLIIQSKNSDTIDISSNSAFNNITALSNEIRKAGCTIVSSLLSSISGQYGDVIIDLVLEELKRIENTSWSNYQNKILSDPICLFPQNCEVIERLGIDGFIPTKKVDKLRQEVQIYILLRSLYNQTKRILENPNQNYSIDDIGKNVSEDTFWMLFYDKCGVSPEYVADSIFKMKGKKYLDVYKCPTTIQTSIVSIPNESYYDMSTSSMLSSLTFGFLGSSTASAAISLASNKRSSTNLSSTTTSPQPQPTVVTAKPIVSPNPGNSFKPLYGQLLFVQDRSNLLLIRPEVPPVSTHKPGEKIRGTFIVHISAPLIQTDVSVDPINKCIMKIIVKSWQLPQPNMEIITLDKIYHPTSLPSTIDVTTSPNKIYQNRIITKSPTFLNPLVHSTLYQINIGFEYAQACSLAVEHIVSRRKAIRSDKIKQLKKAFQSWLSLNPTE